jgi:iron complex outermembrane receptor protein
MYCPIIIVKYFVSIFIMKNLILSAIILFSFSLTAFAQQMLRGKVIDGATDKPLAGASVAFAGSGGTTTDQDGNFSIECIRGKRITISYVGYESHSLSIKNCDAELNITLVPVGRMLQNVEISATSNINKALIYQPAAITKLTSLELNRGTGLFLDDAINTNVPGVMMNRRSVSGGQQFNIRGYGNGTRGTRGISSNFDGQGYKVYLNGIPVTDAEGITTFDDLDYASIGNVEVTKGPAGTLYGLAIAGAINFSTIKPEKGKTSIGQEVTVGNYGLQRYTTQFETDQERSAIVLNYGHQQSEGFSIHNNSKKDFVNFSGNFQPNEKQNIMTYVGYSKSYDQRFGELTIQQWNNNDYTGNPEYLKRDAHSNVITIRAGVGHTYDFTKSVSNTTSVFGTGFTSNASSAAGWTDKNTINYGLRSVFNTKASLSNEASLSGITGIEMQRQDANVIGFSMKANPYDPNPNTWVYGVSPYWVINANTSNTAFVSTTGSLFTEWSLALKNDLSFTAGVGASNMKINLHDRFNPAIATRPADYEKKYTNMISPHFAVNKVINKHVSVYAAYSKGYKAPVSSYFFIATPADTASATPATGRVNETLKPEVGNQFEVGTKGQLLNSRFVYELAYFHTQFSNKMTAVAVKKPSSPNTTLYSYVVNGGEQNNNGVEALVKFTAYQSDKGFFELIRPFANLTYSDFTYGDSFKIQKSVTATEDYSGKHVGGVPKWMANAGVDVMMKYGFYANLTYNYKDKVPITSLNDIYATSYNLLNGKMGMKRALGKHFDLDLYLGANNITNTKYYIMVFVNQLPDAYLPAPKFTNVFGGFNLKYNL